MSIAGAADRLLTFAIGGSAQLPPAPRKDKTVVRGQLCRPWHAVEFRLQARPSKTPRLAARLAMRLIVSKTPQRHESSHNARRDRLQ
jgi:hypothetical protein